MACVQSQKPSFQYLYDAPVQRRITPIDYHFRSHVCGFCVASLGLRYGSRPAHQDTHQSFSAGTSGATQNHAQVGPSSGAYALWRSFWSCVLEACPAEKRLLSENLVTDRRMPCYAQVWLRMEAGRVSISFVY